CLPRLDPGFASISQPVSKTNMLRPGIVEGSVADLQLARSWWQGERAAAQREHLAFEYHVFNKDCGRTGRRTKLRRIYRHDAAYGGEIKRARMTAQSRRRIAA